MLYQNNAYRHGETSVAVAAGSALGVEAVASASADSLALPG